jgi:hypothetical protein
MREWLDVVQDFLVFGDVSVNSIFVCVASRGREMRCSDQDGSHLLYSIPQLSVQIVCTIVFS